MILQHLKSNFTRYRTLVWWFFFLLTLQILKYFPSLSSCLHDLWSLVHNSYPCFFLSMDTCQLSMYTVADSLKQKCTVAAFCRYLKFLFVKHSEVAGKLIKLARLCPPHTYLIRNKTDSSLSWVELIINHFKNVKKTISLIGVAIRKYSKFQNLFKHFK